MKYKTKEKKAIKKTTKKTVCWMVSEDSLDSDDRIEGTIYLDKENMMDDLCGGETVIEITYSKIYKAKRNEITLIEN